MCCQRPGDADEGLYECVAPNELMVRRAADDGMRRPSADVHHQRGHPEFSLQYKLLIDGQNIDSHRRQSGHMYLSTWCYNHRYQWGKKRVFPLPEENVFLTKIKINYLRVLCDRPTFLNLLLPKLIVNHLLWDAGSDLGVLQSAPANSSFKSSRIFSIST